MGLSPSAWSIGPANFENDIRTDRKLSDYIGGSRNAVCGTDALVVTPTPSQHSVRVSMGEAFVKGRNVALSQGSYFCWSDSSDDVPLPVPQANAYYATLVLRVADPQYGTVTGTVGSYYQIVPGTPSGSPAPVSDAVITTYGGNIPGGWLRIADVLINPADSGAIPVGQIVDRREFTGKVSGAPIPCTSTNRPASPYVGMKIWEIDSKQERIWDGTIWAWSAGVKPYGRMQKKDGFQGTNGPGNPAIQAMVLDRVAGGVTHTGGGTGDQSNPGYLVIKDSGYYRIRITMYVSGNAARVLGSFVINNGTAGAAGDIQLTDIVIIDKPTTADLAGHGDMLVKLEAGQRVRMTASTQTAATNTYGIGGTASSQGLVTSISVEWVSA